MVVVWLGYWNEIHGFPYVSFDIDTEMTLDVSLPPLPALRLERQRGQMCLALEATDTAEDATDPLLDAWLGQLEQYETRTGNLYREPVQPDSTRLDETRRDSRLEARGLMAVLCTSDGPKPRHTVPPTFPRCSQPIVRTEPPSAQNLTEPGFCILLHLDHLVALLSL